MQIFLFFSKSLRLSCAKPYKISICLFPGNHYPAEDGYFYWLDYAHNTRERAMSRCRIMMPEDPFQIPIIEALIREAKIDGRLSYDIKLFCSR